MACPEHHAQLPGLPHHSVLPAVQSSWESTELTERQFQKILEITAKILHMSFWKCFEASPWNRQSKLPRTSIRKLAMCQVRTYKLRSNGCRKRWQSTCSPNDTIFSPRHRVNPLIPHSWHENKLKETTAGRNSPFSKFQNIEGENFVFLTPSKIKGRYPITFPQRLVL